MEKLISMTDFVLEQVKRKVSVVSHMICIEYYANFLKQELNIGMFVPAKEVNGVWVVLEEPKGIKCCGGIQNDCDCRGDLQYDPEDVYEYQKAKENILFCRKSKDEYAFYEDCTILNDRIVFSKSGKVFGIHKAEEYKTIEDLVKYNLTLTKSAKQKLGL